MTVLCFTSVATQSTTLDQNATAGSQGLGAAADNTSAYYPTNVMAQREFSPARNPYGNLTNVIVDWNLAAQQLGRTSGYDPPRLLSLMHLAQWQSMKAAGGPSTNYSMEAVAGYAAHFVLAQLLPSNLKDYDVLLAAQLANVTEPEATAAQSIATAAATALLQNRTNDGTQRFLVVPIAGPGGPPGQYQYSPNQTYPRNQNKANATSYVIPSPLSQLNSTTLRPPAVPSQAFNAALEYTLDFGRTNSTNRTDYQTDTAKFWYDEDVGNQGLTAHYNSVALASLPANTSVFDTAHFFALFNVAQSDGRIAYFTMKYDNLFWRPITAIRQLGSARAGPDPGWEPLLATVPEPDYPSGHSTLSGAAEAVLRNWFGTDNHTFTITSEYPALGVYPPPGSKPLPARTYTSFSAAAIDTSNSRLYAGVHFPFDVIDGRIVGNQVGDYVFHNFEQRWSNAPPTVRAGGVGTA
ncbi:hypothetical protein ABBQ32_012857 [Trebouxia sp. C0010 RCD-2024]